MGVEPTPTVSPHWSHWGAAGSPGARKPQDHSRRCSSSSSHLHPLSGLHQWEITTEHTYSDTQSMTAPVLSLLPSRPASSGLPLAAGLETCVCELYPSRLSWTRPGTGAGPGPAQERAGTGLIVVTSLRTGTGPGPAHIRAGTGRGPIAIHSESQRDLES